MITLFENFNDEPTHKKGDRVVWLLENSKNVPVSYDVEYGDVCEITDIKKKVDIKWNIFEIFVKAKNLETGKMINLLWDGNGHKRPRHEDGHWIKDYYFENELKFMARKYNL